MLSFGTPIRKEKLVELCNFYSDCRDFLTGFFNTCQAQDLGTNLVNYCRDLELYRKTEFWRTTDLELYHAFFEIIGQKIEKNYCKLN
jgi:hypothetical protein